MEYFKIPWNKDSSEFQSPFCLKKIKLKSGVFKVLTRKGSRPNFIPSFPRHCQRGVVQVNRQHKTPASSGRPRVLCAWLWRGLHRPRPGWCGCPGCSAPTYQEMAAAAWVASWSPRCWRLPAGAPPRARSCTQRQTGTGYTAFSGSSRHCLKCQRWGWLPVHATSCFY